MKRSSTNTAGQSAGRKRWFSLSPFLLLLVISGLFPARSHGLEAERWIEVDRIVATIEGQPILLSDLLLESGLGLLEGAAETGENAMRDAFVNRLLILREVEDVGGFRLSVGLEESAYQGYVSRFGSGDAYRALLARWGLDDAEVRRRLNRALLASLYTENRIRFFVRVLPADVERAYAESPSRWSGKPLTEAWDQVRERLEEEAFDHEKDRWLESLASRYRLRRIDEEGGEEP